MKLILLHMLQNNFLQPTLIRAEDLICATWNSELNLALVTIRAPSGSALTIEVCEPLEQIMQKVNG